ncbi:hypothetical protein HKX48_002901 [Thoreauomyces humboldtii]|nr:hypothetical protein HKX48_002901 [Thoreauomyces humboldtii]
MADGMLRSSSFSPDFMDLTNVPVPHPPDDTRSLSPDFLIGSRPAAGTGSQPSPSSLAAQAATRRQRQAEELVAKREPKPKTEPQQEVLDVEAIDLCDDGPPPGFSSDADYAAYLHRRINDDRNGADIIDLTEDDYTQLALQSRNETIAAGDEEIARRLQQEEELAEEQLRSQDEAFARSLEMDDLQIVSSTFPNATNSALHQNGVEIERVKDEIDPVLADWDQTQEWMRAFKQESPAPSPSPNFAVGGSSSSFRPVKNESQRPPFHVLSPTTSVSTSNGIKNEPYLRQVPPWGQQVNASAALPASQALSNLHAAVRGLSKQPRAGYLPQMPPWKDEVKAEDDAGSDNEAEIPAGMKPPVNLGFGGDDDEETKKQLRTLLENVSHTTEITPPEARIQSPPQLKLTLLEHQKIGLEWMLKMEAGSNKGGILADDMGLGKTVSSISLILSNNVTGDHQLGTLVVCPVSLIYQWEKEILDKVQGRALSVFVYHGAGRPKKVTALERYDVVLTSYAILSNEWPQPPKKKRKFAGVVDRQEQQDQADAEFEQNLAEAEDPAVLRRTAGPLFKKRWRRVILDEAHIVKNKNTRGAKACCNLLATYRWCLSGTPIQNNVGELYSLLKFLDISPFCDWDYFRKQVIVPLKFAYSWPRGMKRVMFILKSVCLRRNKKSTIDGKPIIELKEKHVEPARADFSEAEREFYSGLETRIQLKFNAYVRAGTVMKNYSNILVLLLRLRQACCHPSLVASDFDKSEDPVPPSEAERFDEIIKGWDPVVAARIAEMDLSQECVICLDAIDKGIITTCGHVFCSECLTAALTSHTASDRERRCPSCRGTVSIDQVVSTAYYKKVHAPKPTSPENSKDIKGKGPAFDEDEGEHDPEIDQIIEDIAKDPVEQDLPSTKIVKLIEILEETRRTHPGEKTIVFSQFIGMLDLVEKALTKRRFRFVRYDGSMSATTRNENLMLLAADKKVTVLLVSLKCGSLGLNLTCANRVVLLDVWWNPAVENQAIDRVHRFGQQKECYVHSVTIPDTVEDRILALQQKKQALFNAALGEGDGAQSAANARLSLRDLMSLFNSNNDPAEEPGAGSRGRRGLPPGRFDLNDGISDDE